MAQIATLDTALFGIIFKWKVKFQPWLKTLILSAPNSAWKNFKDFLIQYMNKHAPIMERSVSGRDCPWLTPEIRQHMEEQELYLSKARKYGKECD